MPEEGKKRKSGVSKFIGIVKHFTRPVYIKIVLIVVCVALISSISIGISSVVTAKSRMVNFGLKDIGELATQAGHFTNVQVISGSRKIWGADIPLTQSKYIFSYDGVIKAGIDFEQIEVNVDDAARVITVKLPEIKILSSEVDPKSLQIYDETKSIFTPLSLSSVNMSLIEMDEEVREKAIGNGILENARTNAEALITGFLAGTFDLQKYSIQFA